MEIEYIAEVCHEANRVLQNRVPDPTISVSPPWDLLDPHTRASAIDGVAAIVTGQVHSPAESHKNWLAFKVGEGWRWGPVKSNDRKEHPLLIPYDEVPDEHKVKDRLFFAIVKALTD